MTTATAPNIGDVQARIVKIMSAYEQADGELQGIVGMLRPEDSNRARRAAMSQIRGILVITGKKRGSSVGNLVKLAYTRGLHLVEPEDKLTENDLTAVSIFSEILDNDLISAERNVLRNAQNAIRKLNLVSVSKASGGYLGHDLQAAGLVDSGGTRWRLSTYAAMAIRTIAHEALTKGSVESMKNHDYDVIKVSTSRETSAACAPWDGGTFSLSGNTPEYKTLLAVPPFHPNCEHYLYYDGGE